MSANAIIPSWLVEERRQICLRCEKREGCAVAFACFADVSRCPEKRHPSWLERRAEKAWPAGVERISGCCDRME